MNVEAQKRSHDEIRRATSMVGGLARALNALQDVTSQSRRYLLTGDAAYLAPWRRAEQDLREAARGLDAWTGGDPEIEGGARRVQALVAQDLDEVRAEMEPEQGGRRSQSLAAIRLNAARPTLGRLREAVDDLQDKEDARIEVSRARADRHGAQLQFVTLLTITVVLALATFLFLDARRRFLQLASANALLDREVAAKTAHLSAALEAERAASREIGELKSALDQHAIVATTDARGVITYVNDRFCAVSKYSREELLGRTHALVNSGHRPAGLLQGPVGDHRQRPDLARRNQEPRQGRRDLLGGHHHRPFLDARGRPRQYIAIRTDITGLKNAEEHIRFLMGEVNHRAKNLLSVVQSVAVLSAREADPGEFAANLSHRIAGLAASQDLLIHSEWKGVDVAELLRAQLSPFRDAIDSRILLSGPALRVGAGAAQAIGMAVHELATNAARYGALSNGEGVVPHRLERDRRAGRRPVPDGMARGRRPRRGGAHAKRVRAEGDDRDGRAGGQGRGGHRLSRGRLVLGLFARQWKRWWRRRERSFLPNRKFPVPRRSGPEGRALARAEDRSGLANRRPMSSTACDPATPKFAMASHVYLACGFKTQRNLLS